MSLVFVSHAAVDKEIAREFKNDITADFLGLCEIFVSSNLDSIQAGHEWANVIKQNLEKCSILVGLLSPVALQRPWVYCEFGAGWIRGIPTIPVCHSGLERGQLPAPISSFQALNLWDPEHLEHLYSLVSQSLKCRAPAIDFDERSKRYHSITDRIRLQRLILDWMKQLFVWNPQLSVKIFSGSFADDILVPASFDQPFEEFIHEAARRGYLKIERAGMAMGTRVGAQASVFTFTPGDNFSELVGHLA
ncbi:hypothetical protein M2360_003888 [Rhizobium sp. SG_E_25_P2]|uniref:toll/interleukin-1 receptor domain-containing protein n=1 Tax=Rhizobium sp. SG_E_25_P2 TaxID=2879942 RepID=UPI0024766602|nr:toll/interleukin-1 receptor domain-containing protein [Rhizobium sp. SG_E_25_P2]MDH6268482.1 hypothetical protein [Rhizobium sp. SG_E_25_P2]